jgi:hypothetical protein
MVACERECDSISDLPSDNKQTMLSWCGGSGTIGFGISKQFGFLA